MALCHGWAGGRDLGTLIEGSMSGGDFVRITKMVIDVLTQIGELAGDLGTRTSARRAVEAMRRGVVADFGPSAPIPESADVAPGAVGEGGGALAPSVETP